MKLTAFLGGGRSGRVAGAVGLGAWRQDGAGLPEPIHVARPAKVPPRVVGSRSHESGAVVVTSERPVSREDVAAAVAEAGYTIPVRRPRGRDILAACGQLKSETEKLTARERLALRAMAMTD